MIHHRIGFALCSVAGLLAVLWLALVVRRGRELELRLLARNNLKAIGQAISIYHETNSRLPSGGVFSADNSPGVGWMVAILPYLEPSAIYPRIDFNQAWDAPSNRSLLRVPHPVYRIPGGTRSRSSKYNDCAHYSANLHIIGINSSVAVQDITNAGGVFLVGELGGDFVPWACPYNCRVLKSLNADPAIYGRYDRTGAFFLFGDYRVDFIANNTAAEILNKMAGDNFASTDTGSTEFLAPKEIVCE